MRKLLLLLFATFLLLVDSSFVKAQLVVTGNDSINVLCFNNSTGVAAADASGGTMPYTYLWSDPDNQTTEAATGLGAGTYTVTVMDASVPAYTVTATVIITQAPAIIITPNSTSSSCGGSTGTASVSVTGGTSPYTYSWTPSGETTATATGLSGGLYNITVTDANNCQYNLTVTVAQTSDIFVSVSGIQNEPCHGDCVGKATINASLGATPYTYSWSSGQTTSNATLLCAGTYTVTINDQNNCPTQELVTITQPPPIVVTTTVTAYPVCFGDSTGAGEWLTISGGTPPYTYYWSTTPTTSAVSISGLSAGTYNLNVTDAHGCTGSGSITITQPAQVTGSISPTPPLCNGGSDGSANLTATGGTSPYTYLWSNGQTGNPATGLSAGTYSVSITDINGCTGSAVVTVPTPPPLTVSITPNNPMCFGVIGSATANPGGGTSPYTYAWSDAATQTTATATGLTMGTYSVYVTDNNGCTATAITTLSEPTQLTIVNATTYPLCNGVGTGTDTAHVSGGISPYVYSWAASGGSDSIASGLSVGTYTLTVNDANGCITSSVVTITQPPPLTVSITPTDPLCNGGLGSATANPTGGTTPYTYLWSDASSQTAATATGLSVGTYSVSVIDANGCTGTASTNIAQPTPVTGSASSTGEGCNGESNGTATVSGAGGTSPYTYSWSSISNTTTSASGLSAGTYTITITDNNNCTGQVTVVVTQPNIITTTFNTTNIACNGSGTGSSTVIATGGTSPYTYSWSNAQTTQTINGLTIGTYTITITDINGCTGTGSTTITEPTALSVTADSTDVQCFGGKGTATANPAGGTTPYVYLWSDAQTTQTATGLAAGTYTVGVKDANGCTGSAVVVITQPPLLIVSITSSDPSCNGGTGLATANTGGGTTPYIYIWSGSGQTNATATGLTAFSYTVLVTDNNGCTASASVDITQPAPITSGFAITSPLCNGTTGSATSNPAGGTSPYTYAWGIGQNTQTATGLTAGTYSITITDINSCTGTAMVTITQPNALDITSLTSTLDNCGDANGTATVAVSGGTPNYSYLWEPTGQTTPTATGLNSGTYTITITDANGCNITETEVVNNTSTLSVSTSGSGLLCNGADDGVANAIAAGGVSPYTYDWSTLPAQTNATATGLTAGTYTVTLTDNTGCSCFAVFVLTQPTAISLTTNTTPSNCANNAGTATVSATGGTGLYTYLWSNGATTTNIAGIGSGIYTVTVTDANGCSVTTTCTVNTHLGVTGFISSQTNVACFGDNIGGATLTITTGTSPYTYAWSGGTGSTTNSVTNLSAGTYTVGVEDANGCIFTASVIITGPSSPLTIVSIIPTNSSCNNTNDGTITFTVSGGSLPYTYNWSNHESGQTDTGLLPGEYTCTVTDNNECTIVDSDNVSAAVTVLAAPNADTILCHTNTVISLNGSASTNASSFAWYQLDPPSAPILLGNTAIVSTTPPLGKTVYELQATNGVCTDTSYDTVYVAPAIANAGTSQDIFGFQSVTIGGSPTGSGGTGPYSYLWSPSSSMNDSALFPNPTVSPSVTTVYTVLVTNAEGCTASDTVTVFVFASVTVPGGFSPNGDGINDTWILPFAYAFPSIQVYVYNRWGELVFSSNGYTVPWDGEYDGKPLPIGTYYYVILLNDPRYPKALTGPVTILR